MNPRSMSLLVKPPPRGEDLPYDDGEPMETQRHFEMMHQLVHTLRRAWRDRPDVFVNGNMGFYFSETQARNNDFRAPDVMVVLGTQRKERKSWVVWEEGGRVPDLVIELVSESTEHVDRGAKLRTYQSLRVPVYVIYDPFSAQLDVYQLNPTDGRYARLEPDTHGRVWCEPVGLHLGVVPARRYEIEAPWLRWIDRDGRVLLEGDERADLDAQRAEAATAQAEAATAQAEAATARADAEAARAARLEAELAALRAKNQA